MADKMPREEVIRRAKYAIVGLVTDGIVSRRSGGELAMYLEAAIKTVETTIGRVYDAGAQDADARAARPAQRGKTNGSEGQNGQAGG